MARLGIDSNYPGGNRGAGHFPPGRVAHRLSVATQQQRSERAASGPSVTSPDPRPKFSGVAGSDVIRKGQSAVNQRWSGDGNEGSRERSAEVESPGREP